MKTELRKRKQQTNTRQGHLLELLDLLDLDPDNTCKMNESQIRKAHIERLGLKDILGKESIRLDRTLLKIISIIIGISITMILCIWYTN